MILLPSVLLLAALGLFLLSTLQRLRRWRLLVLVMGTLLLAAATLQNISGTSSTGVLSTLARHPDLVAAAFTGNWPSIGEFIAPALDVLLFMTAAVCIGCFIALTPGEAVERTIRPVNVGLIGAVLGGAIALLVAAIGFGPVAKRQVFIAYVDAVDAIDGDTIRMGDVSLRLWGVDAPEDHQICLDQQDMAFDCGQRAKDALVKLAIPGPVFCHTPSGLGAAGTGSAQLKESFGRPLVRCGSDQQGYGAVPDIARALVAMGYAYPYESPDGVIENDYAPEKQDAVIAEIGLHSGVFTPPTKWRNELQARCNVVWRHKGIANADPTETERLQLQIERLEKSCGQPASAVTHAGP